MTGDFADRVGRAFCAAALIALAACGTAGPPRDAREPTPPSPPTEFYAEEHGRIAAYDVANGQRVRYLTDEIVGGSFRPTVVEQGMKILFIHGGGTCASSIASVGTQGGEWHQEPSPKKGYALEAVHSHAGLSWIEQLGCEDFAAMYLVVAASDADGFQAKTAAPEIIKGLAAGGRWLSFFIGPPEDPELRISDSVDELGDVTVEPKDHQCIWQTATWRATPETTSLLTAQRCPTGVLLVEYDEDGKNPEVQANLGDIEVDSMDFDEAGRELLLGTHPTDDETHTEVWHWDGTHEPRRVAEGLYSPTW